MLLMVVMGTQTLYGEDTAGDLIPRTERLPFQICIPRSLPDAGFTPRQSPVIVGRWAVRPSSPEGFPWPEGKARGMGRETIERDGIMPHGPERRSRTRREVAEGWTGNC
jgi:hypothetical protein